MPQCALSKTKERTFILVANVRAYKTRGFIQQNWLTQGIFRVSLRSMLSCSCSSTWTFGVKTKKKKKTIETLLWHNFQEGRQSYVLCYRWGMSNLQNLGWKCISKARSYSNWDCIHRGANHSMLFLLLPLNSTIRIPKIFIVNGMAHLIYASFPIKAFWLENQVLSMMRIHVFIFSLDQRVLI